MTDYIKRADAIEAVCRTRCGDKAKGCPAHSCLVIEEFDALPSAKYITEKPNDAVKASNDVINRSDAIDAVHEYFKDRMGKSKCDYDEELQVYVVGKEERTMLTYNKGINDKLRSLPSAEAVQGYTEWLEKIIVDNEGANEWLCEDTPDLEWCEKNCHYSSIQAECLRHLYEVSKGGDTERRET